MKRFFVSFFLTPLIQNVAERMSEDVSNDLHSVRPCAQIRSLLVSPRTLVCVRTHAITHRERQHRTVA